jgi:hypothetical protein
VAKSFEAEQGWRRKLLFGEGDRKPVTSSSPSPYAIQRAEDKDVSTLLIKKTRMKHRIEQLFPDFPPVHLLSSTPSTTSNLARRNARVLAVVADSVLELLGLNVVVVGALELNTKLLDAGGASVGDGCDIAVVCEYRSVMRASNVRQRSSTYWS